VASKVALQQLHAFQLAYIRQAIAGSSFLLFFLLFKKQPLPTGKQFFYLFYMAVLMMVFANALSTWGLKYIPTGLASLIGALYPLSVVLIEWVFYKKRNVSVSTFAGLIIGIAGVGFVFYQNMFTHANNNWLLGLSLSLFAMFSWSLGTVLLSRNQTGINPYYAMGWQMLMGSVMLFFISLNNSEALPLKEINTQTWLMIAYLVVAGSIISFIAFIYSLKVLPPTISSLYAYINPIVAMLVASIVLNEKLTFTIFIGTVITLVGVYLVNQSVKKDINVITEAEI
jgi:drug/metabolite transporter (DMT)-like permease